MRQQHAQDARLDAEATTASDGRWRPIPQAHAQLEPSHARSRVGPIGSIERASNELSHGQACAHRFVDEKGMLAICQKHMRPPAHR